MAQPVITGVSNVALPNSADSGNVAVTIPAGTNACYFGGTYFNSSTQLPTSFTGTLLADVNLLSVDGTGSFMTTYAGHARVTGTGAGTVRLQKTGTYSEGPTCQIVWLTVDNSSDFVRDIKLATPDDYAALSVTLNTVSGDLVCGIFGKDSNDTLTVPSGYTQTGTTQTTNNDNAMAFYSTSPSTPTATITAPGISFPSLSGISLKGGGAGDVTAPTLTSATGTSTGPTTASGSVSTNEANGTLYRQASTTAAPSAATVIAAGLTSTVTTTGVQNVSFTGLTASTLYYAHYVHVDAAGNQSTRISSSSFTTDASDSTAPTLTSPTAVGKSNALIAASVSTNEANGTLYVVATTSATPPTATQIRAGQNNAGTAAVFASNQAVSSTGVKTFNITGLSALTTYYVYFHHRDSSNNDSAVSSVSAATFRAGATGQYIIDNTGPIGGNPGGILYNDVDAGDEDKWFSFVITTPPASGTLDINPDGTFTFEGAEAVFFQYQLEVDGVNVGSPVSVYLYEAGEAAPTGAVLKYWNGSAFVTGVLKYWNGSAFVAGTLRVWNGTTWIPQPVIHLAFDSATTAELAAATTKEEWATILIAALSGSRTIECKRGTATDVWTSGTTFFTAPMTGSIAATAGDITSFGTVGVATTQLAADLSTGYAALRISAGARWIQASLGLTGSSASFTLPTNPTTTTGFGFTAGAKLLAPASLPSEVPDTTAPVLTSPTGTQTGQTTASGTVTTDEANGTLYRLASTNSTELASTVISAALTQTVTATGVQNVTFTGLTAGTTYYAHYVHVDAATNQSTRVSSGSFTTAAADVTAPTLTSPTGTQTGSSSATGTVSTNEANGTLYSLASTSAAPSASTVISSGFAQAVTTTGVQNVSFSGLIANTTYYAHYVHVDAASNQSTRVSSATFTTADNAGTIIDTFTLRNTSGSTQTADFVSPMFGFAFKQGDVPAGTHIQFELSGGTVCPHTPSGLATWPDGSLKKGGFIMRVPSTIAGSGTLTINVRNGATVPAASTRTLSDLTAANLSLEITGVSGLTGTWIASLNDAITANTDVVEVGSGPAGKIWRVGGDFKQSSAAHGQLYCWHYVMALTNSSGGLLGVRHLGQAAQPWGDVTTPTPATRVVTAVYKTGASTIRTLSGHNGSETAGSSISMDHYTSFATCGTNAKYDFVQGGGTAAADSTVEIVFNKSNFIRTKLVPAYDTTLSTSSSTSVNYVAYCRGHMTRYTPTTGERDDIGVLPAWCVRHLMTQASVDERAVRVNAMAAGGWRIYVRRSTTKNIIACADISASYDGLGTIQTGWRHWPDAYMTGLVNPASWSSLWGEEFCSHHRASAFYYAYLITGEPQYADMLANMASVTMLNMEPNTQGWSTANPLTEPVTGGYGERGASFNSVTYKGAGLIFRQDVYRIPAWGSRDVAHAAAILPDSGTAYAGAKTYFKDVITSCYTATNAYNALRPQSWRDSGLWSLNSFGNNSYYYESPWALGYLSNSVCHQASILPDTPAVEFRQHLSKFYSRMHEHADVACIAAYRMLQFKPGSIRIEDSSEAAFLFFDCTLTFSTSTSRGTVSGSNGAWSPTNGDIFVFSTRLDAGKPFTEATDERRLYAVNCTGKTFQLSLTPGGSPVTVTSNATITSFAAKIQNISPGWSFEGYSGNDAYVANIYSAMRHHIACGDSNVNAASTRQDTLLAASGSSFGSNPKNAIVKNYPT